MPTNIPTPAIKAACLAYEPYGRNRGAVSKAEMARMTRALEAYEKALWRPIGEYQNRFDSSGDQETIVAAKCGESGYVWTAVANYNERDDRWLSVEDGLVEPIAFRPLPLPPEKEE